MATFIAKKSCGVKKKPMINLEELIFFILVSTSGASDWQACEDSQWNKRTTFDFRKIVIYNPWTWKQSEDSLKISLTPKRSLQVFKSFFCYGVRLGTKSIITFRIVYFFLCEATKGAGDWRNCKLTWKSSNT